MENKAILPTTPPSEIDSNSLEIINEFTFSFAEDTIVIINNANIVYVLFMILILFLRKEESFIHRVECFQFKRKYKK